VKSTYIKKIKKIESDIKSIKIQGATNVALATVLGIKVVADNFKDDSKRLISEIRKVGDRLSLARENEPLARNAVRYILSSAKKISDEVSMFQIVTNACDAYESMIADAKVEITKNGTEALIKESVVLTHCHSSTSVTTLKNVAKFKEIEGKIFKVIATETRPLYQGRKTAKKLMEAGVDVTQIVDSACASFIVGDEYHPVGAVIVGCDELLKDGSFINKVGTFSIAISAKQGADEFYVATTLLKLDPSRKPKLAKIEQRDAREVWDGAPKGLKIINPAFERVEAKYVTGYITEAGVLKGSELIENAKRVYPWLVK
jgi:ribose 1,5-bisphosphate isomerase